MDKRIYLSPPHLGDHELEYIKDALESNWVAPLGPHVDAFEKEIGEYIGIENTLALSSGTAALHLALKLVDIKPGDTVFCSDLTFVASANVILYEKAIPVFIDSDLISWTMCPKALEKAFINSQKNDKLPKAVIVTDIYGQSANYDKLIEICDQYNVPVIEDAAEALGAEYKNKKCGSFGKMAILSFNGNKMITTSGGGMLLSHNPDLIKKARFLSTQARDNAIHYEHSELGYNYRMSNILAALGRGQLRILNHHVQSCRDIFSQYVNGLSTISEIQFMPEPDYGISTRWLTTCMISPNHFGVNKDSIIKALENENIECRPLWKPMHLQPLYNKYKMISFKDSSVSSNLFNHGICLPSGVNLSIKDQDRIMSIMAKIF
jgi:pyridoxal phosphate-dependent aminotransferase EpsN